MRLVNAQVTNFRCIEDSGRVELGEVTCLVGKNESGKTAFLQALHHINPFSGEGRFELGDYPRKALPRYRQVHDRTPATAVRAEFKLSAEEIQRIESAFGVGVLRSHTIAVQKDYKNARMWNVDLNERVAVHHLIDHAALTPELEQQARNCATLDELISLLKRLPDPPPTAARLFGDLQQRFADGLALEIINEFLAVVLPRFIYFDEYSLMRGRISVTDLRERQASGALDRGDETFLCLLTLAGLTLDDLEHEQNYNKLKIALEAASITLTEQMAKYWTQNQHLEAEFDVAEADPSDPPPLDTGRILHVRIKNTRHRVSLPFDDRSHGFVWFFSFLAYFSQLEARGGDLVVLLDEPGLSLHAKAQRDFLRFLDEGLAARHMVIYTTHSPFLVGASQLDRVRTVQDMEGRGTVVGTDLSHNDRDTIFPLRASLAFELAQSLFDAPHTLVVRRPTDAIYVQLLSEATGVRRRIRLDPRWTIVPIGASAKAAMFLSLLRAKPQHLAVLMDQAGPDRAPLSDVEDLFDAALFLELVNGAYQAELEEPMTLLAFKADGGPIVPKLERYFRDREPPIEFSRQQVATYFLLNQGRLVSQLDEETIDRCAAMFERLNALLPRVDPQGSPVPSSPVQLA